MEYNHFKNNQTTKKALHYLPPNSRKIADNDLIFDRCFIKGGKKTQIVLDNVSFQLVNSLFGSWGSVILHISKHYRELRLNSAVIFSQKKLPDGFFEEVCQKRLVTACILKL